MVRTSSSNLSQSHQIRMIQDYDVIISTFDDQISLEKSEIGMRNDWPGMSIDWNWLIFIIFFIRLYAKYSKRTVRNIEKERNNFFHQKKRGNKTPTTIFETLSIVNDSYLLNTPRISEAQSFDLYDFRNLCTQLDPCKFTFPHLLVRFNRKQ